MNLEDFLRSTTSLIAAIGALIAALASLAATLRSRKVNRPTATTSSKQPGLSQPKRRAHARRSINNLQILTFVLGISLLTLSIGVFIARSFVPPLPLVTITNPATETQVEMNLQSDIGSGFFSVTGTSSEVLKVPNRRIFVLLHPDDPFASGWWIQQLPTVDEKGLWSTQAWYGGQGTPPKIGNRILVMAVVADPQTVGTQTHINDPKDIEPKSQSNIIKITIGSVK